MPQIEAEGSESRKDYEERNEYFIHLIPSNSPAITFRPTERGEKQD
jgi:hypothetical protein